MKYYCYIIYSAKLDRYYTGHTENLTTRVEQHNEGINKSTAKTSDWRLVYSEEFDSRKEAKGRESEIKKKKSRKYIEWLIELAG